MQARRHFIISTFVLSGFGLISRFGKSIVNREESYAKGELSKTFYNPRWADPVEVSYKNIELNSDKSFSSYVVANNNKFARDVCFSFADSCMEFPHYPLFIQAGQGMGSTHLLHAIGNHVRDKNPDIKIRIISGERFVNEVVASIRRGVIDELRKRYLCDCDLLLIDDIQIVARGNVVQEEFFRLLTERDYLCLPLVITSDLTPRKIDGLEERIQDRLEGGVVVSIYSPDQKTRLAVLRNKSSHRGVNLDDDTAEFISSIADQSIRQLEGHLNKLIIYSDIYKEPITLEMAKRVLV